MTEHEAAFKIAESQNVAQMMIIFFVCATIVFVVAILANTFIDKQIYTKTKPSPTRSSDAQFPTWTYTEHTYRDPDDDGSDDEDDDVVEDHVSTLPRIPPAEV